MYPCKDAMLDVPYIALVLECVPTKQAQWNFNWKKWLVCSTSEHNLHVKLKCQEKNVFLARKLLLLGL